MKSARRIQVLLFLSLFVFSACLSKNNISVVNNDSAFNIEKKVQKEKQSNTVDEDFVRLNARETARQLNNYIIKHPEYTLSDLQNDPSFRALAIQEVGNNGYTGVMDSKTGYFYFHPQEKIINTDLHLFEEELPDFVEILDKTIGEECRSSSGYYDWKEADGNITKKFLATACIDSPTADNKKLFVGSTSYIDKKRADKYIKEYGIRNSFENSRLAIKQKAEDVAKQVEIYLRSNPQATIADLQSDSYFQEIAVQPVGSNGWTSITDQDTSEQYFSHQEEMVGRKISDFKNNMPGTWNAFKEGFLEKCNNDGAYFSWINSEGELRDKYAYSVCVDVLTADGKRLGVDASVYIDKYADESSVADNAKIVSRQIDRYLKDHPNMTLEDLQDDAEFWSIAVQNTDNEGYTGIVGSETGYFYFHPQDRLVNTDFNDLKEKLPALWRIFNKTVGEECSDAMGYYDWIESSGERTKKFLVNSCVSTPTADGYKFFVFSSAYLNKDKAIEYIDKYQIDYKVNFSKIAIKNKSRDVARQIKLYLENNPNKTLSDLQNDSLFQTVAVQRVGKTGYTALTNQDSFVVLFHKNKDLVGVDLHSLSKKLPGFWNIMKSSKEENEVSGLYDWEEVDGTISQKFMYITRVDAKTADGVVMNVAATTYLDEYEDLEKQIKENKTGFIGKEFSNFDLYKSSLVNIERNKNLFNDLLSREKDIIRNELSQFIKDNKYKNIFLENDREKLYKESFELFEKNKKDKNISHFYYIKPDGEVFLRVHKKEKYGDILNRESFKQAQEKDDWGDELELGKTSFALRVVHPYYLNGVLIGYIEFAEDINSVLAKLEEQAGNEFAVVVDKKYIDRRKWEEIKRTKNERINYDDFEDYVIIENTDKTSLIFSSLAFSNKDISETSDNGEMYHQFVLGEKTFLSGGFPINDYNGNRMGVVVSVQDVSDLFLDQNNKSKLSSNVDENNMKSFDYNKYLYLFLIVLASLFLALFLLYYFEIIRFEKGSLIIILIFFFVLVGVMLVVGTRATINNLKGHFMTSYIEQHIRLENILGNEIVELVSSMEAELKYISRNTTDGSCSGKKCFDLLKGSYERNKTYLESSRRIDKNASIENVYPLDISVVGKTLNKKEDFLKVENNLEPVFGSVYNSENGLSLIDFQYPVINKDGFDGVIEFVINSENFFNSTNLFSKFVYSHDSFLLDSDGNIISSGQDFNETNILKISRYKSNRDELNNILVSNKEGNKQLFIDGEKWVATYVPVKFLDNKIFILVFSREGDAYQGIDSTLKDIWVFTFVALGIFVVLGLLFSFFITRSLRREVEKKTLAIKESAEKIEEQLKKEELSAKEKEDLLKQQILIKKELENKVEEMEKFNKLVVDRELKMVDLKLEIEKLKKERRVNK